LISGFGISKKVIVLFDFEMSHILELLASQPEDAVGKAILKAVLLGAVLTRKAWRVKSADPH
jgi:hypothetical protein